jgi:hypothetical protein
MGTSVRYRIHNSRPLIPVILRHMNPFPFTVCDCPTNALVCNKTLIQMSQTKTLKITPTDFDHQMIIISFLILVKITG